MRRVPSGLSDLCDSCSAQGPDTTLLSQCVIINVEGVADQNSAPCQEHVEGLGSGDWGLAEIHVQCGCNKQAAPNQDADQINLQGRIRTHNYIFSN